MTLDELKARRKELQARKQEELELQARGEGDNLALFMVEEELLEVKAQIRALTPGKRIGSKGGHLKGADYNYDRKQFQDWLEEDQDISEDGIPDSHSVFQGVLAEGQSLMTERQWELFKLWSQGMSMPQIGEHLGVSSSTVSRTIGRAKKQLQKVASMRNLVKDDLEDICLDMSDPAIFKAVLSCITETQIVYLYLYFGEYLSCGEIANLLGRNMSTVSRTLHRGLEGISRAFAVPHVDLKNMAALGEAAYQFYVTNNDLEDPPEPPRPDHQYWGRMSLRKSSYDIPETPPQSVCAVAEDDLPEDNLPADEPELKTESTVFEAAGEPHTVPERCGFLHSSPSLLPVSQSLSPGPRPPQRSFGKLVSALLERKRRYQKYTQRKESPMRYWLEQIFHGLSKWWGHGK